MTHAYLVDGLRTPIGRYGGALSGIRPDDLAARVLSGLAARHPAVDWAELDDVVLGATNQAGEDNRNVARMALLLAGLPQEVPGSTVNALEIRRRGAARAVATMCVGVGQGVAVLVEQP